MAIWTGEWDICGVMAHWCEYMTGSHQAACPKADKITCIRMNRLLAVPIKSDYNWSRSTVIYNLKLLSGYGRLGYCLSKWLYIWLGIATGAYISLKIYLDMYKYTHRTNSIIWAYCIISTLGLSHVPRTCGLSLFHVTVTQNSGLWT
jgi:hypothetical protein